VDPRLLQVIVEATAKIALILFVNLTLIAYLTLLERRVSAWIQDRRGPNRVGPFGLLQPLADGIKFIFKEAILPAQAHKVLYLLAPVIIFVPAMVTFSVIPFGPSLDLFGMRIPLRIADVDSGILVILGLSSLGVYGIALAGWASNN